MREANLPKKDTSRKGDTCLNPAWTRGIGTEQMCQDCQGTCVIFLKAVTHNSWMINKEPDGFVYNLWSTEYGHFYH